MSLADELLADLEDLHGADEADAEAENETVSATDFTSSSKRQKINENDDMAMDFTPTNAADRAEQEALQKANEKLLATRDLKQIARIWSSGELQQVLDVCSLIIGDSTLTVILL